jgi:hypothetical protein
MNSAGLVGNLPRQEGEDFCVGFVRSERATRDVVYDRKTLALLTCEERQLKTFSVSTTFGSSRDESSLGKKSQTPKSLQPIYLSRSEYSCRLLGKIKFALVAKSSISGRLPNAKFLLLFEESRGFSGNMSPVRPVSRQECELRIPY